MSIDSESGFEAESSDETRVRREDESPDTDSGFTVAVKPFDLESSETEESPQGSGKRKNEDPESDRFVPGRNLGDFELIQEVGRGGMGLVYEARQRSLGKRVAVKILPASALMDRRVVRRFQNEAWAAAQLQHRNIVPVYQVGVERGTYYYAMQFVDGLNLSELFQSLKLASERRVHNHSTNQPVSSRTPGGPKGTHGDQNSRNELANKQGGSARGKSGGSSGRRDSTHRSNQSRKDTMNSQQLIQFVEKNRTTSNPEFLAALAQIGIQVADALHYAHEMGIVHRDVKPSNLLMDLDGEVWVSDFGLAQIENNTGLTATGAMVGTLRYMSPEQIVGRRLGVDHRTDIYSLGISLYELLTLRHAFAGESREMIMRKITFDDPIAPRKIDRRIPVELETIIMKSISKNPSDRYQTAEELANDLRRFRDNEPIKGRKPNVAQRLTRWSSRNKPLVASLATLALTAFVASIAIATANWNLYTATAAALQTEQEKNLAVKKLYRRSEGLRLAANSSIELDDDPTLAALLATAGAKAFPGAATNTAIIDAVDVQYEYLTLTGHVSKVGDISFNDDGTRLISCSHPSRFEDGPDPAIIWDTSDGRQVGQLKAEKTITSAMYSPDRFRILTVSFPIMKPGDQDGFDEVKTIEPALWDAVNLERLVRFKDGYAEKAHRLSFDVEGRRAVFPSKGNTATIYDCVGGHKLANMPGHEGRVVFAGFTPSGDKVVTTSTDNTVRIWDATDGKPLKTLTLWKDRRPQETRCLIRTVSFDATGKILLTGADASLGTHLWDLESGDLKSSSQIPGSRVHSWPAAPQFLTFKDSGSELVIRSSDSKTLINTLKPRRGINRAAISPDGRWIALQDQRMSGWITIWDPARGAPQSVLKGHRVIVNDIEFSPDSKTVATASSDRTIKLWHVQRGKDRMTFPTRTLPPNQLYTSTKDGSRLAIVSRTDSTFTTLRQFDNADAGAKSRGRCWMPQHSSTRFALTFRDRLSVHSVQDGKEHSSISNPNGNFSHAAISPDGKRVAATVSDLLMLWDPDSQEQWVLSSHPARISDLRFSPSNRLLAAASNDGFIRLWDVDAKRMLPELQCDATPRAMEFSRDGKHLVVATAQNTAIIWDCEKFEKRTTIQSPSAPIDDARFSFDGQHVITFQSAGSKVISVWNAESGDPVSELNVAGNLHIAVCPNEDEALVCSTEEGAFLWQYTDNQKRPVVGTPMATGQFSPDGSHFTLASWIPYSGPPTLTGPPPMNVAPTSITHWKKDGLEQVATLQVADERVVELFVDSDGNPITNGSFFCGVEIYDTRSRELVTHIVGHAFQISDLVFTNEGKQLITSSQDKTISVWDAETGNKLWSLSDNDSSITCLALSRDDRSLLSGLHNGQCTVWDIDSRQATSTVKFGEAPIHAVSFHPGGDQFLALSTEKKLYVRDLKAGENVDLGVEIESVEWAEYSQNGDSILVLQVFDRDNEKQTRSKILVVPSTGGVATSLVYPDSIITAHFDPTGQKVIAAMQDGQVSVRDIKTGVSDLNLSHPAALITGVAFSENGDYIAVATNNRTVVWEVEKDDEDQEEERHAWLSIPRRAVTREANHRFAPFLAGEEQILSMRMDAFQLRSLPIDPAAYVETSQLRELTPVERKRFWLDK